MAKWNKNEIFKRILIIYLIIYSVLLAEFNNPTDCTFSKRSIGDLTQWLSSSIFPPTVILLLFHYVGCKFIFPVIADKVIIASKYQFNLREKRIPLVSTHLFKFCCYLCIGYLGYDALHDMEWLPREFLFGKSGYSGHETMKWLIFERNRFEHELLPLKVQRYFEWTAAYHLHSTIWHLKNSRALYNFYEMLLHHFVTLSLIAFCFLTGHSGIGVLVSILHDLSDIPAYAIKLAVNTSFTVLILTVYALLLIAWIYYRVICFAYVLSWLKIDFVSRRRIHGLDFQTL